MNDLTFIIPNRGGEHVSYVINNFRDAFGEFFTHIKFLVIEQDDDLPFKRGQLYNIAVKYVDTKWIGLIDNDIVNLDKFNPMEIYQEIGGPYICFDKISQLTLNEDGSYNINVTESRLAGYGAFNFMKTSDFCNAGGFSNLCAGWGSEDNILNEKLHLKRFVHTLGHITHKKRKDTSSKLHSFNRSILKQYKEHKIDGVLDGYEYTDCDQTEHVTNEDVSIMKVKNVRVTDSYKYLNLYREFKKMENYDYLKISHYIITRFLNNDRMNLGQRVFDKDVINHGVKLLKNYVIPSLEHQSNKNFTYILIIHDNVNKDYVKELYSIKTSFPKMVLTTTEYKKFIKEKYEEGNYKYFITSRVDYDDMFYYNAVQDIQSTISEKPVSIYTWRYGLIKNECSSEYRLFSPSYQNKGGVSILLSLIINKETCKKTSKFNIYGFNHTKVSQDIKDDFSIYSDKKLWYDPLIVNMQKGPSWVYIRHELSDSGLRRKNNEIARFNIKKFYNIK